jgi:ABC-2 type transport system ATP-binding protein
MITINNLIVGYQKGENIIDSLQVMFSRNEIHGVVGLNGAGKTTLFNAIFGLIPIQQGIILYNGQPLTKKEMAYLPTENFFYSNITGKEYLAIFRNHDFDAERWNELFMLPLDQIIDEYSTGMKKKLALLGVIKQNKPIMLLDEPFNGLDIEMCRILRLILLKLKEAGKTIIVSSHVIETLTNLCDYIHYLENGKIKYSKQKEDFASFEKEIFAMIEKDNMKVINELLNPIINDRY